MESKDHYRNTTKPTQLNLISPLISHFRKNLLFCELPHGSFGFLYPADDLYGFLTTPVCRVPNFPPISHSLIFNTAVTGIK